MGPFNVLHYVHCKMGLGSRNETDGLDLNIKRLGLNGKAGCFVQLLAGPAPSSYQRHAVRQWCQGDGLPTQQFVIVLEEFLQSHLLTLLLPAPTLFPPCLTDPHVHQPLQTFELAYPFMFHCQQIGPFSSCISYQYIVSPVTESVSTISQNEKL